MHALDTGTAHDRVVVCAHQKDFWLPRAAAARYLKIEAANSRNFVCQSLDNIALLFPLTLDVRRRLQPSGMVNIALADLASQLFDVSSEVLH